MYQFEEKDWKLFRKLLPGATENASSPVYKI